MIEWLLLDYTYICGTPDPAYREIKSFWIDLLLFSWLIGSLVEGFRGFDIILCTLSELLFFVAPLNSGSLNSVASVEL